MSDPFQEKSDPAMVPKHVGRPPLLDDEKRRVILALLSNGSSRRVAARYVGCSASTISKAMVRDPEFAAAIFAAEQNVEIESLREIRRAAKEQSNWRAAAWLLERRNPEDFAPRSCDSLSQQQIADIFFIITSRFVKNMTLEELEESLNRLNEMVGEGRLSPERLAALKAKESQAFLDAKSPTKVTNYSTFPPNDSDEFEDEAIPELELDKEVPIFPADATFSSGGSSGE